jgi:hypothetical protein
MPAAVEVNVIDDDEDLGVHFARPGELTSSPDPLRLGADSSTSPIIVDRKRQARSETHAFKIDQPTASGTLEVEESDMIRQLRQRNNERKRKPEVNEVPDSESDSIQEYEDDVRAGSSKPDQSATHHNGDVRQKIQYYEKQKPLRHVDLSSMFKPRPNTYVASKMKPRNNPLQQTGKSIAVGPHYYGIFITTQLRDKIQTTLKFNKISNSGQGFDVPDALSAPSLGPSKSTRSAAARKADTPLMLPLEAWYLGPQLCSNGPHRDYVSWRENSSALSMLRRPPTGSPIVTLETINIDNQVQNIEVRCVRRDETLA